MHFEADAPGQSLEHLGQGFEVLANAGLLGVEPLGVTAMGDVATDALGDRAQLGGDVDVYRRVQK